MYLCMYAGWFGFDFEVQRIEEENPNSIACSSRLLVSNLRSAFGKYAFIVSNHTNTHTHTHIHAHTARIF